MGKENGGVKVGRWVGFSTKTLVSSVPKRPSGWWPIKQAPAYLRKVDRLEGLEGFSSSNKREVED